MRICLRGFAFADLPSLLLGLTIRLTEPSPKLITMDTATLSSKGQLVIPKALRESAGLALGDRLSIRWVDGELRLKPLPPSAVSRLADVAGCLSKPGRQAMTEAQTRAAVRARMKARHMTLHPAP